MRRPVSGWTCPSHRWATRRWACCLLRAVCPAAALFLSPCALVAPGFVLRVCLLHVSLHELNCLDMRTAVLVYSNTHHVALASHHVAPESSPLPASPTRQRPLSLAAQSCLCCSRTLYCCSHFAARHAVGPAARSRFDVALATPSVAQKRHPLNDGGEEDASFGAQAGAERAELGSFSDANMVPAACKRVLPKS